MTRVAQARKHFWTFERTATDNESTLHSTFIHAISLPPTMFTRLRQDANDSLFVLRPWCNVIRVRTPPGRYLLGRHCLVANPNVILSFRLLRKTKIWQHLLHYADYTTSKVIMYFLRKLDKEAKLGSFWKNIYRPRFRGLLCAVTNLISIF